MRGLGGMLAPGAIAEIVGLAYGFYIMGALAIVLTALLSVSLHQHEDF